MFGAWVILLWFLVVVVFLVKLAPTRRIVSAMRQQPLLIQTVAVLTLGLAVINGSTKTNSQNYALSSTNNSFFNTSPSSVILSPSSLSSGLPAWWQGSDTDTDDDGIPDQWEKWTHGNRLVADADIDRDADGLTELEEFQNQTDPRTADTDADGFTDRFEIDNGMNPLTKANFIPNEPDINADGIIDLWEGTSYSYGFNDTDHDGFDDSYEAQSLPDATAENFDVLVNVLTTRSALLTWNNAEGSGGLVILPTTGTVVRLRLPFSADTELALSPSPEGTTAPAGELWKSRLRLAFAPRSGQTTRGGVIIAANGDISQKVIGLSDLITCFPGNTPNLRTLATSSGTTSGNPNITLQYRRLGIAPVSAAWHFVGELIGPFVLTNYAGAVVQNISWSAEHGSISSSGSTTAFLTVTSVPSDYEAVAIIAVSDLGAETYVTNRLPIPKCARKEFGVASATKNFSPHLGEMASFTLDITGCPHFGQEGWLEAEAMRETTAGWQHVAWLDASQAAPGHQKRRHCLVGPQTIMWDGMATEGAALAESPDVFTGGITPFHRALPQVISGEPVPPPYYTIFFRYRAADSDSAEILDETNVKLYVPQVVKVEMTDAAYEEFKKPILYPTTLYPQLLGDPEVVGCESNVLLYPDVPI